ncbi:MAG: hypothetical protein FK730_00365 [Asgard group archaeon]|nr:hypothetical protein [Asgard group archaeon]
MYPYPNDMKPERFLAAIKCKDIDEINNILQKMNFKKDTSKPEESRYKQYNENHSAGWIIIEDNFCYLDVNKIRKTILIEVSGTDEDLFLMDETVFNRTLTIEQFLQKLNLNFIDPPQDDKYCISPKYYPELWD